MGITLYGSKPVMIRTVDVNSPADHCGLLENDVILSINDIDVENKNHQFLVDFLQTSGQNPILEVMQKSEYELFNNRLCSATTSLSNFSATNSILELRNSEGKSFREKINELFCLTERDILKTILRNYKNNKYINIDFVLFQFYNFNFLREICVFLENLNKLLSESPAKRDLWYFIMPIIDENHIEIARNFIKSTSRTVSLESCFCNTQPLFNNKTCNNNDQNTNSFTECYSSLSPG